MLNKPQVTTLQNGIRVVTYYKPNQRICTAMSVNVGSLVETTDENGLTHFVEHMLFKGTSKRSAVDISREIEITGSDMNAFTSYDMTTYYIEGLSENTETSLGVLSDMLLNSLFDPDAVRSEQDVVCQEIAMYIDNMRDRARNGLMAAAFPEQSAGRAIIGHADNVRSFDQQKIKSFLTKNYHTANLVVAAIGDCAHDDFVAMVTKYFGAAVVGENQNSPEKADYVGGFFKHADHTREQAIAILAYPLAKDHTRADRRRFEVLSEMFGGAMSSPLFQEVRENRGLCYSISSNIMSHASGSLFTIGGGTSPDLVEEMLLVARDELLRIAHGDINPDDLTRAKNSVKMALLKLEDDLVQIAAFSSRDLYDGVAFETADEIMAEVNAMTIGDMQEAAAYLLSQKATISMAGNVPDIEWIEGI